MYLYTNPYLSSSLLSGVGERFVLHTESLLGLRMLEHPLYLLRNARRSFSKSW